MNNALNDIEPVGYAHPNDLGPDFIDDGGFYVACESGDAYKVPIYRHAALEASFAAGFEACREMAKSVCRNVSDDFDPTRRALHCYKKIAALTPPTEQAEPPKPGKST